jgi:ADP-ribose pyrophosphatase YjhB (NUDIX family)/GNAT superfamily N-acetyltransferase
MERRVVDDREREVCPACDFIFYRNPTPAVGVVVALDGNVVLVRRKYEPRAGYWALPAGFMELGESVEEAAIRECHEETGLLVRIDHLLGVYSFGVGQHTGLLVVYAATATGGVLTAADDATEADAFPPDALPTPLAFRSHLQAIDRFLRERRSATGFHFPGAAGGAVQVRPAVSSDEPDALGLLLGALPPDSDRYVAAEALFHDRLHDIDRPILVAERDGAIAGVALLSFHQTLHEWYATIDDLVVAAPRRWHVIGRALVAAAAELARGRGCAVLHMIAPYDDEAREFLVASGFVAGETLTLQLTPHPRE